MSEQNSNQKDKNHLCLNCQITLLGNPEFCHNCGQKNTKAKLTVRELFSQFFDNVFNVDSKIFRTIGALFVPGKLTNAFLGGQRLKYYHPIRLFLVLILISLAALTSKDDFAISMNLKKEHIDKLKERKRLMGVLDQGIESIAEKTNDPSVIETLDSLSNTFYKNSGNRIDSININNAMKITDDFDFFISIEDFEKYSAEEILDVYKVKGFFKRLMVQQKIKMIKEETSFLPFVMSKVTWVVFFVLLLLSLLFKLLYFRKNILYLEHLIFSMHLYSFFLIFVPILSFFSGNTIGYLIPFTLIIIAIYFFIAMKRVYKQSFVMTSMKFLVVLAANFFLFIFGIVLTVIGSFFIF